MHDQSNVKVRHIHIPFPHFPFKFKLTWSKSLVLTQKYNDAVSSIYAWNFGSSWNHSIFNQKKKDNYYHSKLRICRQASSEPRKTDGWVSFYLPVASHVCPRDVLLHSWIRQISLGRCKQRKKNSRKVLAYYLISTTQYAGLQAHSCHSSL